MKYRLKFLWALLKVLFTFSHWDDDITITYDGKISWRENEATFDVCKYIMAIAKNPKRKLLDLTGRKLHLMRIHMKVCPSCDQMSDNVIRKGYK